MGKEGLSSLVVSPFPKPGGSFAQENERFSLFLAGMEE